jgi:branched-chain amino acid transport system ATP-binding protein
MTILPDHAPSYRPVLEVESLSIRFGGLSALNDISFEVGPGEIVGLIGPNGAGKSTVLNCVCGIYKPTSGRIRIEGVDTVGASLHTMRSRGVARTFQETLFIEDVSIRDNVMLGRTVLRRRDLLTGIVNLPAARRQYRAEVQRAQALLAECGLDGWSDTIAASVPYGVRKLAEVARAQFTNPQLLLLDEPAAGLGPVDAERLADRLSTLARSGIAIVLIDHNIDFVARTAHRVVVMSAGALLAEGTPEAIRRDPSVAEAYLGHGKGGARA